MKPIRIPVEDSIDLHTFRPEDVSDLLSQYFQECIANGIYTVRIIHGKGKGILKNHVAGILKKSPYVISFFDSPPERGGWGSTIAELKRRE
ncbi:MAG: Smr/MutS family protein [Proteobacteria bacterium]|nr:Smr/MutS family protein [Pseudomonadota bacterium]MBU4009772.1 Smr/MutS family protein [Pseudomonadota bacterium]